MLPSEGDPAVEVGEVELVVSVALGDVEELGGGALVADAGVERDAPERRVEDVVAVGGHVVEVASEEVPEGFGPGGEAVVVGDAVDVEPVDVVEGLRR